MLTSRAVEMSFQAVVLSGPAPSVPGSDRALVGRVTPGTCGLSAQIDGAAVPSGR